MKHNLQNRKSCATRILSRKNRNFEEKKFHEIQSRQYRKENQINLNDV